MISCLERVLTNLGLILTPAMPVMLFVLVVVFVALMMLVMVFTPMRMAVLFVMVGMLVRVPVMTMFARMVMLVIVSAAHGQSSLFACIRKKAAMGPVV